MSKKKWSFKEFWKSLKFLKISHKQPYKCQNHAKWSKWFSTIVWTRATRAVGRCSVLQSQGCWFHSCCLLKRGGLQSYIVWALVVFQFMINKIPQDNFKFLKICSPHNFWKHPHASSFILMIGGCKCVCDAQILKHPPKALSKTHLLKTTKMRWKV